MLYRRLFVGAYVKYSYQSLLALVIAYGLWTFWSSVFTCFPIQNFWSNPMTSENCIDRMQQWSANAAINILTDVLIFACPIPVLRVSRIKESAQVSMV